MAEYSKQANQKICMHLKQRSRFGWLRLAAGIDVICIILAYYWKLAVAKDYYVVPQVMPMHSRLIQVYESFASM